MFFIVTTVLNYLYKEELFKRGVNFIYNYQTAIPSEVYQVFNNLVTNFCGTQGIGVVLVLLFLIPKRQLRTLVHASFFLIGIEIVAIMKQQIQESRPIWFSDLIQRYEWFCPKDFGNPSGHSFAVFMMYEPLLSDFLSCTSNKARMLLVLLLALLVPQSRMYLGVHSANQIMFGLTLGITLNTTYRYFFQERLYTFYGNLLILKKAIYLLLTIIAHILFIAIPFVIFELNVMNKPM